MKIAKFLIRKVVQYCDSNERTAILVVLIAFALFLIFKIINNSELENYSFDLVKRKYRDKRIINYIKVTIAMNALITSLILFIIGFTSIYERAKKTSIEEYNQLAKEAKKTVYDSYGGYDSFMEVKKETQNMNIRGFDLTETGEFTKESLDYINTLYSNEVLYF